MKRFGSFVSLTLTSAQTDQFFSLNKQINLMIITQKVLNIIESMNFSKCEIQYSNIIYYTWHTHVPIS